MFLVERMVGVGTYMLLLLMVLVMINNQRQKLSAVFIFYILSLTVMSLLYKPYVTTDLYRIRSIIEYFGTLDWNTFYRLELVGSLSPAADLLYYVFGKLDLTNYISVFSCIVCYSIVFWVIFKYYKEYNLNRSDVSLMVLFVMSSNLFIPVISGIRMMISLCLLLICFCRISWFGKFKLRWVILCMLAVAIHAMAVVVVGIAIVAFILSKSTRKSVKFFALVLGVAFICYIVLVNNSALEKLINKYYFYTEEETYFDIWEFIIGVIMLLVDFSVLLLLRRSGKKKDFFCLFVGLSTCLAVVFVSSFSIFHRLTVETNSLMLLPLLPAIFSLEQSKEKQDFRKIFLLLSIFLLLLSVTRGSTSALKFFEFNH